MRQLIVIAICWATCAPCTGQDLLDEAELPIQAQLEKVVKAFGTSHRGQWHLNAAAVEELNTLNQSVSDKDEIVKQIAIFAAGKGEEQPLVARLILDVLQPPPDIIIRTLAPHLEARDEKIRSFVRDWFQFHDQGGPDDDPLKGVNFKDYVKYVRGQWSNVPAPFVEYIYGRSPERALIVFYRADPQDAVAAIKAEARKVEAARRQSDNADVAIPQKPAVRQKKRQILLAAHRVSETIWLKKNGFSDEFEKALPEAKERLAELAGRKEWWVRLYVATIMRWNPELRVAEVLEKLSHDGHASVSKTAKSLKG